MVVVGGEGRGTEDAKRKRNIFCEQSSTLFWGFCELEQYPGAIHLCVITLQTRKGKGTCESNLQTNNLKRKKA